MKPVPGTGPRIRAVNAPLCVRCNHGFFFLDEHRMACINKECTEYRIVYKIPTIALTRADDQSIITKTERETIEEKLRTAIADVKSYHPDVSDREISAMFDTVTTPADTSSEEEID